MKFNDTQTSYSNEQSSYINYSVFNPFPSSGHLNNEKDDGSGGNIQQSRCVRPSVSTLSAGRWSRWSRVRMGDPRALWLLQVKSISAVTTSSSSLPAAMFRRTALLLAPCNHGVEACVGQDSTQSGPGWMHGCMDGWMEGQTLCSPTVRHQPPQHPWELHPGPAPQKMCSQRDSDPSSAFGESFAEHFGRTKEQPTLSLEIFQIIENSWDFISRLRAFLHKVELKDVVKVQQVTECFIESGLWSTTNLSQLGRETENLS